MDPDVARYVSQSYENDPDSEAEARNSGPAKPTLAGNFNNAFKRFENSAPDLVQPNAASVSPPKQLSRPATIIPQVEARTDRGIYQNDEETLTPAQRRDLEKAQLEEEERRVEAAQAEYRKRVADEEPSSSGSMPLPRSIGGVSRAVSIQNRVQNLLSESQNPSPVQRTAEGYGKYSDTATAASKPSKPTPVIDRKPVPISKTRTDIIPSVLAVGQPLKSNTGPATVRPAARPKPGPKPQAPKKPIHLTGDRPPSPQKKAPSNRLQQLISEDVISGQSQPIALDMTEQEKDDYVQDFSKRFPSLGAIEMVEHEYGADGRRTGR